MVNYTLNVTLVFTFLVYNLLNFTTAHRFPTSGHQNTTTALTPRNKYSSNMHSKLGNAVSSLIN